GSGVNAAGAARPAAEVASVVADGMRLASAAALSAGTGTLLPSRGIDTSDEPAAASPLRTPARHRRASAMSVRVRMSVFSFQQPEPKQTMLSPTRPGFFELRVFQPVMALMPPDGAGVVP